MKSGWWSRFIFMIVVAVVCAMTVLPSFYSIDEESAYPFKGKINLGLDLQGGLYIVLGIDFDKVYRDELNASLKSVVKFLEDEGINAELQVPSLKESSDPKQALKFLDNAQAQTAKPMIREYFSQAIRLTAEQDSQLTYGLEINKKTNIQENSVTKSIEVIRNRIDEFGVTEPEIFSQGSDRIVVQLPGVDDIERAKSLIGQTAKLEFRAVNDEVGDQQIVSWLEKAEEEGILYEKGERYSLYLERLNNFLADDLPEGHEIAFERRLNKKTNEVISEIPYLLEIEPGVTGENLDDANVRMDPQDNRPYVALSFNSTGAKLFEKTTKRLVGKRLAITLDGNVYSAPVVQTVIGGGQASITMNATSYEEGLSQATELALVLRAGALPVELEFEEQRVVGPSLGADSIESARFASLIGCGAVFLFILLWYKTSGVIAITTLGLNVLIVFSFLVGLGATLTLPGIAGIALTVGMAVDANIIIYERIKQELSEGMSILAAVQSGFDRAFWTIVDANLTTAAAGVALLNFGTGPIRGFAVTLLIGIFATIYTSYFASQVFFEWYMERTKGKDIKI